MRNIAKKLAAILLALALLCGLAVAAGAAAGPKKFVVLGDSISAGEGATDPSKAYAELIAAAKGYKLSNFAVGGHKTTDLLKILAENKDAQKAIREADIINVSIGGNDLLASNVITLILRFIVMGDDSVMDEYVEEIAVRFAEIVKEIRKLNKNALFIVQTLYNAMEGIPLVEVGYEAAIAKLNQMYYDYLEANPGAYVIADVHGAFKCRDGLVFDDRLHPSDAGHAMIAKVLTATIEGKPLNLEPAPNYPIYMRAYYKQVGIFVRALVDYLGYWLTRMTPWELVMKAFSFIF